MATTPAAVGTIKVIPDLSEFAARLTQEISFDDPLAHAIMDATNADPANINAFVSVGERIFALHHWTLIAARDGEPARLRTSWVEPVDRQMLGHRQS